MHKSGQAMVHNVLATRMILHLREVAEETLVIDSRHTRVPTRAGAAPNRGGRKEGIRDSPWYMSSRPVHELSGFVAAGNWGVRSVGVGSRGEGTVE
jgi:hypothetical protein